MSLPIVFIQMKNEQTTSSVSSFTSSAMTVTAGNAIVQDMSGSAAGLLTLTASDSQVDTFNTVVWRHQTTGGAPIGLVTIAWARNIVGGSTTFTVTPDTAAFVSLCAKEYSGLGTTVEAVKAAEATGANVLPGAITAPTPNSLYVVAWTHDGSGNQGFTFNVSGEGWTGRSRLTLTANQPLGSQDLIAIGSKTGNATNVGAAADWDAVVATFPPAETNVASPAIFIKRDPLQQRMS